MYLLLLLLLFLIMGLFIYFLLFLYCSEEQLGLKAPLSSIQASGLE